MSEHCAMIADLMMAAGYSAKMTGGGCRAWAKALPDESEIWICSDENDLYADPAAAEWLIGRHDLEGGSVVCDDSLTLLRAVGLAAKLPAVEPKGAIISLPPSQIGGR